MRDLLAALDHALQNSQPCVVCSVVETRGSTPQKAGAFMLVFADGSQTGTLGGGCVEAEVKRQALRALNETDPAPQVHTFNLDDNYGWDDGLICGGRMSILADPLSPGPTHGHRGRAAAYFHRFHQMVAAGKGCTEAVIVQSGSHNAQLGSRFLFDAQGILVDQLAAGPAPAEVQARLLPLQPRPKPYQGGGAAFLPVLPRVTLLIVGGGHVGQAVAQLAVQLDFEVWALDDRASYVAADRFPGARRRLVGDIGQELAKLTQENAIDPSVFALIVTRGHGHDEEALFHLANTPAGYVGMIGSKRKIKLIYEDLVARGISKEALTRVHAPLGFAIGSQTVPEIAVSILAELIAVRNLGHTIAQARLNVKLD